MGDDSAWDLLGSREVGQLLKDFEQDHLLLDPALLPGAFIV